MVCITLTTINLTVYRKLLKAKAHTPLCIESIMKPRMKVPISQSLSFGKIKLCLHLHNLNISYESMQMGCAHLMFQIKNFNICLISSAGCSLFLLANSAESIIFSWLLSFQIRFIHPLSCVFCTQSFQKFLQIF